VENRGFGALEAPPKREKQMNTRGPIYRLAGHWSAFERTTCVRTHQLFVVERRVYVRPQIIAVAARVKCLSSTYALSQNQIATLVFKNIIYGTCGY
jgi:hypothetical protein